MNLLSQVHVCFLILNICDSVVKSTNATITTSSTSATLLPREIAEDAALNTAGLIIKYGFQIEIYNVTTEDGYVLELHRIPKPGKQPVYLQHGLLDSSASFVLMGPDKGLAYILSQQGYDVWLGNSRGNRYSRRHINMSTDDVQYWTFSWHEIGVYDLPAVIDFIIENTRFPRIHYIGHSQGTTAFFVMASERPSYNSKIVLMQALAPIVYFSNARSPLRRILWNILEPMSFASSALGFYEIPPNSKLVANFGQKSCFGDPRKIKYCSNFLFIIGGFDAEGMNMTMLPVIYGHVPAGASILQIIHYGQVMKSGEFRQFDYGRIRNLVKYRSLHPPAYNLMRITTPVILHYSSNDYLSAPEDVEYLSKQLPRVISKRLVPMEKFNHFDFIWGINAKELLYNDVLLNMIRMDRENRSAVGTS